MKCPHDHWVLRDHEIVDLLLKFHYGVLAFGWVEVIDYLLIILKFRDVHLLTEVSNGSARQFHFPVHVKRHLVQFLRRWIVDLLVLDAYLE